MQIVWFKSWLWGIHSHLIRLQAEPQEVELLLSPHFLRTAHIKDQHDHLKGQSDY